jgi:hypothetical protein
VVAPITSLFDRGCDNHVKRQAQQALLAGGESYQAGKSDNQVPMAGMRTMTATEASRNFSDLLDAIELEEAVTITREIV